MINFGERLATLNPLGLFTTSGFGRWAYFGTLSPAAWDRHDTS